MKTLTFGGTSRIPVQTVTQSLIVWSILIWTKIKIAAQNVNLAH